MLDEIKSLLTQYFDIQENISTVILFGSFAKGCANEKSDIDIAVYAREELTVETMLSLQSDLQKVCNKDIDIVDLRTAEGVFLHQIMTTGIRIKFDRKIYEYYALKALYFYEDFLPIVRSVQDEKIKRFVYGK